jgi:hypothetical protein
MVKYQSMLCKNLHVQLEVVKTVNLAILLQVNSSPTEHDCLEIMDEDLQLARLDQPAH